MYETQPAIRSSSSRASFGRVEGRPVVGPNGQGIEPGSFAEIVRAMRAGTANANIHTTRWPLGEIRGQINDVDQKQFEE